MGEGYFKPGSMLPKIEAILEFLEGGGEKAIITSPEAGTAERSPGLLDTGRTKQYGFCLLSAYAEDHALSPWMNA